MIESLPALRTIWRELMGDLLATVSEPRALWESTLYVVVTTPGWVRELESTESEILALLKDPRLPPITQLRFYPGRERMSR